VDFLVLSRASSATVRPVDEPGLNERHWSYMDGFADGMTARGPTLGPDRETWTGSMHVVSLPSADDVHAFVSEEPYERAGLFESHRTWRFTNLLGRTMWDHVGRPDQPRFLVLARQAPGLPDEAVIMLGELSTLDGDPAGFALAVQLPDRSALDDLDAGLEAEVHDWEPGGRR
jgi:uncharacterized protein YciI